MLMVRVCYMLIVRVCYMLIVRVCYMFLTLVSTALSELIIGTNTHRVLFFFCATVTD